jgi:hypothetical protein
MFSLGLRRSGIHWAVPDSSREPAELAFNQFGIEVFVCVITD